MEKRDYDMPEPLKIPKMQKADITTEEQVLLHQGSRESPAV
jgi:hypothetical protein